MSKDNCNREERFSYLLDNFSAQYEIEDTLPISSNDLNTIIPLSDNISTIGTTWEERDQHKPEQLVSATSFLELYPLVNTTGSDIEIHTYGEIVSISDEINIAPQTNISNSLTNINAFRADTRFTAIDGSGFAAVILDTGIDLDHPFFGADQDGDGVADRIVYHYDFAHQDADARDFNGHGSNVSSIVASSDTIYTGMAPAADIIHLKVFQDNGFGSFSYVEQALQWVIANADTYNIASVNMSLGDSKNWNYPQSRYGIGDELAILADLDIAVVSASGNNFYSFNSVQGVSYPAVDPNSLSIGAVFDSNIGSGITWSSGATAYTTGSDRITPFSQRHETLTDIFAPGAAITGANAYGGISTMYGTSQAAPHIAGIVVLAQQLAVEKLGRRLTVTELNNLLTSTGTTINDGDDENDNVSNTGLDFQRVDVLGLGEAILDMADLPTTKKIGEVGSITNLSKTSQTIILSGNYKNPVIFAQPLSYNGTDPATVRLSNITNNSFTISIQEPSNKDGIHWMAENFSYIVLEAGNWELEDGTRLEVGTLNTDGLVTLGDWNTVNFEVSFDTNPVVFSQVQTFNGKDFVGTRQRQTSTNSFAVGMEEEEARKYTGHINETIGYFAIESGSGNWSGLQYQAGQTVETFTDKWSTLDFSLNFKSAPQLLASIATYNGTDSAGLRYRNKDNDSVEIKIEEETSLDAETTHTKESLSFLAITGSGLLEAKTYDPLTGLNIAVNDTSENYNFSFESEQLQRDSGEKIDFSSDNIVLQSDFSSIAEAEIHGIYKETSNILSAEISVIASETKQCPAFGESVLDDTYASFHSIPLAMTYYG
ncbi:MAG: S8 family serine peptidase [Nostocales cyanobacterium 94392]|nr:S8 family serine peptidase [Nostocales cyanobacterium 94392]